MTPIQEAYALMQEMPESNVKLIVDLLRMMTPLKKGESEIQTVGKPFKRTGLAKEAIYLPDDFDECFDKLDQEISELFYGCENGGFL